MSLKTQKDATLIKTKALPAANGTAVTDPIYLGKAGIELADCEFRLECEALPSLVDTKKATFIFEDSADGTNYAAIPELASVVLTGAGGAGAAAFVRDVRLPSSVRSYVRGNATVENGGGDNTSKKFTFTLLG